MALVTENGKAVLILVVMEYTQWDWKVLAPEYPISRLNPCCNGIYSMREGACKNVLIASVLILVVMEYTQWVAVFDLSLVIPRLNPCCNGIYSMRRVLW